MKTSKKLLLAIAGGLALSTASSSAALLFTFSEVGNDAFRSIPLSVLAETNFDWASDTMIKVYLAIFFIITAYQWLKKRKWLK